MGINRRNFLQKVLVSASATCVTSNLLSKNSNTNILSAPNSWTEIASLFPINKNKIYFNNGTMGPSPTPVTDVLIEKIHSVDSTGHYRDYEQSRIQLAAYIGAENSEISLTHNTTEGINILCWGLKLKKGDEIIICNHEHVGGALPWLNLAKIKQLKVSVFQLGKTASETIEQLKKSISSKTRVIAIPHITCTTGQIQPIKEINQWAKSKNIKLVIDGAHGLGLYPLQMKELGIDYYAGCCHKWLCAPKGTGFIYINKEVINTILPHFVGAGSDSGWNTNLPAAPSIYGYASGGHRFDYGTQNTSIWFGVNAALQFFNEIGKEEIYKRNQFFCKYFMERFKTIKNYELISPPNLEDVLGMVSFKHKTKKNTDLNEFFGKEKIRLRLVPEHGLDAIRVSFHIYNSEEQIDTLISVLEKNA